MLFSLHSSKFANIVLAIQTSAVVVRITPHHCHYSPILNKEKSNSYILVVS